MCGTQYGPSLRVLNMRSCKLVQYAPTAAPPQACACRIRMVHATSLRRRQTPASGRHRGGGGAAAKPLHSWPHGPTRARAGSQGRMGPSRPQARQCGTTAKPCAQPPPGARRRRLAGCRGPGSQVSELDLGFLARCPSFCAQGRAAHADAAAARGG